MELQKKLNKLSKLFQEQWWAKYKYIKYYEKMEIDENIILIESQQGQEMHGNVFYLLRYLTQNEKYKDFNIYLSAKKEEVKKFRLLIAAHNMKNVTVTVLGSHKYLKLMASAKYLINDNTFLPFFIKKDGQVYLNTWHGTPLKSLGRGIKDDAYAIGNAQKNFVCADYILFPNEHTKNAIVKDYMIENISNGSYIMAGYPRNEAFFDDERKAAIKRMLKLKNTKIYAYMPTFRGTARTGGTERDTHYLYYYLYEADKQLHDDEILYVNLHPVSKNDVDFDQFNHIRAFPDEYETYEFLNVADVLITDYSSVFFDFACTGKKIVLFPYDRDEYLKDRGLYMSMDSLPFPKVYNSSDLVQELRSPKQYDDSEFFDKFCLYENANASQKLCDYVILGEDTGLKAEKIPNNNKENVLLFVGNLAPNGITTSVRNLLNCLDLDKRNYYIYFLQRQVAPYQSVLTTFPEKASYYASNGSINLTLFDRQFYKAFNKGRISTDLYMKLMGKRVRQDFDRSFKGTSFDKIIHFTGYDRNVIVKLSTFEGSKYIFVHSDMLAEISVRHNSQKSLLKYAYNKYDKVVPITNGILKSTYALAGKKEDITVIENVIDYKSVIEKSQRDIQLDENTTLSVSKKKLMSVLRSSAPKFISIGRFGPEKGHKRLVDAFQKLLAKNPEIHLIIMGGSSYNNSYQELIEYIGEKGLKDKVILIMRVSNPYPILNACDYFVLSSFYEGFGLVLAEADILNKPVISTDIDGPRAFMQKNGGTLVESSEEGLLNGMQMLLDGKIKPMNIDYESYNQKVIEKFERLLS